MAFAAAFGDSIVVVVVVVVAEAFVVVVATCRVDDCWGGNTVVARSRDVGPWGPCGHRPQGPSCYWARENPCSFGD